jgi:hypothetical protein
MLKFVLLAAVALCGVASVPHAQERTASTPYQPTAVGGVQLATPNCAPYHMVGVENGRFVCKAMPNCTSSQMLGVQAGQLVCRDLPAPTLPTCTAAQAVTVSGGQLTCRDLPQQVAIPTCTATQVLGVTSGRLVCRDSTEPTVVADGSRGCMRSGVMQFCYGAYTPRTTITFAQPFLDDSYGVSVTTEGDQDRFSSIVTKTRSSIYLYSYASASGSKNSGASGTYVAIGRWK